MINKYKSLVKIENYKKYVNSMMEKLLKEIEELKNMKK